MDGAALFCADPDDPTDAPNDDAEGDDVPLNSSVELSSSEIEVKVEVDHKEDDDYSTDEDTTGNPAGPSLLELCEDDEVTLEALERFSPEDAKETDYVRRPVSFHAVARDDASLARVVRRRDGLLCTYSARTGKPVHVLCANGWSTRRCWSTCTGFGRKRLRSWTTCVALSLFLDAWKS